MPNRTDPTARERRYRELTRQVAELGLISPGSVIRRYTRCGKPSCRCQADPPRPHGPYWQWTANIDGKTVTRRLTARQATLYKEWIANDRRLRRLIRRMRRAADDAIELILRANQT